MDGYFFGDTWQLRGKIKFIFGDENIQSFYDKPVMFSGKMFLMVLTNNNTFCAKIHSNANIFYLSIMLKSI